MSLLNNYFFYLLITAMIQLAAFPLSFRRGGQGVRLIFPFQYNNHFSPKNCVKPALREIRQGKAVCR